MRWISRIGTAVLVLFVLWLVLYGGRVSASQDEIFANGFGDDPCDGCNAGGDPPLSCDGVAPEGFTRTTLLQTFVNGVGYATRDATTLRGLYGGQVTTTKLHYELRRGKFVAFALTGAELEADLPGRTSYAPGGEPQNGEPMAGFIAMTISQCPGDFRWSPDPRGQICRGTSAVNVNDIVYFTIADQASRHPQLANVCTIDRDTTYFLNVVLADPRDGLTPDEHECPDDANSCGARWNIE